MVPFIGQVAGLLLVVAVVEKPNLNVWDFFTKATFSVKA